MSFTPEELNEFKTEALDMLNAAEEALMTIKEQPEFKKVYEAVFRALHNLKGGAGMMGLEQLQAHTHEVESLFMRFKESLSLTEDEVYFFLQGIDAAKKLLDGEPATLNYNLPGAQPVQILQVPEAAMNLNQNSLSSDSKNTTVPEKSKKSEDVTHANIRVATGILDDLLQQLGELVLARNQLLQIVKKFDDTDLNFAAKNMNFITNEIQQTVFKTRLQPVGSVLQKFNRLVLDLSRELGKDIDIKIEGSEIELDKTILEAIKDPLTHIVRNSCDHGIEKPEVRLENGKNKKGQIKIKAFNSSSKLMIQISDDGKGLNPKVLRQKAFEKGIINAHQLNTLSDAESLDLIFAAGFSTAQTISNVSGRGVGMDVVKNNIQKIGGTIELQSIPGNGMTILLSIPQSLSVVPVLIVENDKVKFGIPNSYIEETLIVSSSDKKTRFVNGVEVFETRGITVPVYDLSHLMNNSEMNSDSFSDYFNLVLVHFEGKRFAIKCQKIDDSVDVVLKPLNKILKKAGYYAGVSILGDSSLALIFDIESIFKKLNAQYLQSKDRTQQNTKDVTIIDYDVQSYLIFEVGTKAKFAIVLNYLDRIEDFKTSDFEYVQGKKLVTYNSELLPIIDVAEKIGESKAEPQLNDLYTKVLIIQRSNKKYGLEITRVIDTLETKNHIDDSIVSSPFILGNITDQNKIYTILDPFELIKKTYPSKNTDLVENTHFEKDLENVDKDFAYFCKNMSILIVDDLSFFRNQVKKVFEGLPCKIITANNGQEALTTLNSHHVDLVITDIEMPVMNGMELIKHIRQSLNANIPIIALSSRASSDFTKQAYELGVDIYLEKMVVKSIKHAVANLLEKHKGAAA